MQSLQSPRKDITGQTFGNLTALYDTGRIDEKHYVIWRFRCSCGQEVDRSIGDLRVKANLSCGCQEAPRGGKRDDITGQTFGSLTALYYTGKANAYGSPIWHLKCVCGNEVDLPRKALRFKKYQSCGCQEKPKSAKRKDITGQNFGVLTALSDTGRNDKYGYPIWRFRCTVCGYEFDRTLQGIKKANLLTCRCNAIKDGKLGKSRISIVGQTFGRLTVLEEYKQDGLYLCRCSCTCGKEVVTHKSSLKYGLTKSCGCLRNEILSAAAKKWLERKKEVPASVPSEPLAPGTLPPDPTPSSEKKQTVQESPVAIKISNGRKKQRRDITGQTFGYLTALYDTGRTGQDRYAIWRFRCICGKEIDHSICSINHSKYLSCGCKNEEMKRAAHKDITGKTYGYLTALYDTGRSDDNRNAIWRFRCVCGQEVERAARMVKQSKFASCGCMPWPSRKDITGQTFGFLTALEDTGRNDKFGYAIWRFRCECGKEIERGLQNIDKIKSLSCGCRTKKGKPYTDITCQKFEH